MSSFINSAYAQSTPPAPGATSTQTQVPSGAPAGAAPQQPGFMSMVTLFLPMFLVIYFLIIRPQQKKMKDHQAKIEKIQYGDEVVTNGGLFATVTGITDKVLTVEIAQNVKVKVLKSQVAAINPTLEAQPKGK